MDHYLLPLCAWQENNISRSFKLLEKILSGSAYVLVTHKMPTTIIKMLTTIIKMLTTIITAELSCKLANGLSLS